MRVALLFLFGSFTALAAAVLRYSDPVPAGPRVPLAGRVEELAQELGRAAGRPALAVDTRLEAALAALAESMPRGGTPSHEMISQALWLYGIVEPSPFLLALSVTDGNDGDVLARLRRELTPVMTQARYRRVGASVTRPAPTQVRVLVAMQETLIELDPVPRRLDAAGAAPIGGRLDPSLLHPELIVTAPDGHPARARLADEGGRFRGTFRCVARGRHQVEVVAEGSFGVTVAANFPLYCGVEPPVALARVEEPRPIPWSGVADAEARVLALLARDRAAAGLGPLRPDPRLAAVARGHSVDMRDHGFVGHTSPSTGTPSERVNRAGVERPLVLLENVAVAADPEEVERGFMESPGHRANALDPTVEAVGVGAAVRGEGDARELFVTQLFAHFADPRHDATAPADLAARIADLRREGRVHALAVDPALARLAQVAAEGLAAGRLASADAGKPIDEAQPALAPSYGSVRTVVVVAPEVRQVAASPALLDPRLTHVGVAAVPGRRKEVPVLYMVLVLGVHR